MSDVGEPVDVGPTMIEGVNELVGDDPAHVGLVSDIILAQNDLGDRKTGEVGLLAPHAGPFRRPDFPSPGSPAGSLDSCFSLTSPQVHFR